MIACPFKQPTQTMTRFGATEVAAKRFEQHEGLSLSTFEFAADASDFAWPFESFSQLVFLNRGQISITLPDAGKTTIRSGEWFALSVNDSLANCSFSGSIDIIVVECSKEIWKSLSSETDALLHTKKACFGCAQRLEPVIFKNQLENRMRELATELSQTKGNTPSERLLINAKTLELLALASDSRSMNSAPKPEPCHRDLDEDALSAAAAYLEENLAASHSLAEVSRKAKLNEFKLKKGFRERFNTTVFGYLRQKRMERARQLLSTRRNTVLETAYAVGYSNPSHFTRAFRECFGINPKEFLVSSKQ